MQKSLVRKGLVLGIIVLFVGASVVPSINGDTTTTTISSESDAATSRTIINEGSLSGYVNSTLMNPIEGTLVRVYFHETYEEDYSDSSGYYHVTNIPICWCLKNATASKTGYDREWVLLSIDENTTYDFVLTASAGNTLYVGGSGPGNYTTIQGAIDNASEGDTVFVYDDGSPYYENIDVDESIQLIGENRDTTVINGNNIDDVVRVTSDWVNITGFTITNSGPGDLDSGIKSESDFNCFFNNNISYNRYGIRLYSSSNYTTITDNKLSNNVFGIRLRSNNNTVTVNNVYSHSGYGIGLDSFSNFNKVTGNNVYSNIGDGIYLSSSENNTVIGNNVSNNYDGISLYTASNNNKINGNSVSNNNRGIRIAASDNNMISENNAYSNDDDGIYLVGCENNTVTGNNLLNNSVGICLYYFSNNNKVTENNAYSNSGSGIFLYFSSDNNTVIGNNVSNNYHGICLDSSDNNTFTENNAYSNNCDGICLANSYNNMVTNNVYSNNNRGIRLYASYYNTITENTANSNNNYGIRLDASSNNNNIYHNNLLNNAQNAYDDDNNQWDNNYPSGGNYWDDYNGVDNDGDGIGDTPYSIPGGDNEDRYPFMNPYGWLQSEIDCSGDLDWIDIEPSSTVTGTITVENNGGTESLLDWNIETYPDWGTWSFDPENGIDLLAGDSVTIDVEVIAPNEEEQTFTGEVVLVNTDNPDNTCIIDVSLATPVSQFQSNQQIPIFMQIIIERYPILRQVLGL